nr:MAG: hypothetical protein [Metapenaeopsis lamellata majanivirus]
MSKKAQSGDDSKKKKKPFVVPATDASTDIRLIMTAFKYHISYMNDPHNKPYKQMSRNKIIWTIDGTENGAIDEAIEYLIKKDKRIKVYEGNEKKNELIFTDGQTFDYAITIYTAFKSNRF